MKKGVASVILAVALFFMSVPTAHAAEVIKLKYSNFFPPTEAEGAGGRGAL
jgi:hypothetical protein